MGKSGWFNESRRHSLSALGVRTSQKWERVNPIEIMKESEIRDRYENEIKYKENALNDLFRLWREDGNESYIATIPTRKMSKKEIRELFEEYFDDEPSDLDIKRYMASKKNKGN